MRGPSASDPASCRVASMPSMPGMRTSISTTSGRRSRQIRTASAPSEAVPTTVKSGWVSSSPANPSRTTWWSSATTMRTADGRCGHPVVPRPARATWPRRRSRRPGAGPVRRSPPTAAARSCMPVSPWPPDGCIGGRTRAVVADAHAQRVGPCSAAPRRQRLPARARRALVSASWAMRYAASSTPGSSATGAPCRIRRVPVPDASRASSSRSLSWRRPGCGLALGSVDLCVLAQHAEQAPHLGQRGAGGVADRGQPLRARGGHAGRGQTAPSRPARRPSRCGGRRRRAARGRCGPARRARCARRRSPAMTCRAALCIAASRARRAGRSRPTPRPAPATPAARSGSAPRTCVGRAPPSASTRNGNARAARENRAAGPRWAAGGRAGTGRRAAPPTPAMVSVWNSASDSTLAAVTATAAPAGRPRSASGSVVASASRQSTRANCTVASVTAARDIASVDSQRLRARNRRSTTPEAAAANRRADSGCIRSATPLVRLTYMVPLMSTILAARAPKTSPWPAISPPPVGGMRERRPCPARGMAKMAPRRDDTGRTHSVPFEAWKQPSKSPVCASGSGRPWRSTDCRSRSRPAASPASSGRTARASRPRCG